MNIRGFTVIELIAVIALLTVSGLIVLQQYNQFEQVSRDKDRKTAINSMQLSLERVYFEKNKYYPESINEENLPTVEPNLFKDPQGKQVNTIGSDYRYEPMDCTQSKCTSYLLYANLENEARYKLKSER